LSLIKVLIIDQDPVELNILLKRMLKKGLSVKGVEHTEKVPVVMADFNPDVIIIDPWDANQKEVLDFELFFKNQQNQNVIVLTCQVSQELVNEIMDKGAFDFLVKPCPVEELLMTINHAVKVSL
jgi:DNA-binding NtrC family response regulator